MKTLTLVLLLLLPIREAYSDDHGFAERSARLIDVVSKESEVSFFSLAAKITLGRDLPRAYVIMDSMTHDIAMGGMFYAYTLIGTYLHTRDRLPDSLHQKVRDAFRRRTMYRGDTENHWVMYYTGMYLAAQTWPGEGGDQWFNGRSSAENIQEAREWLEFWMRTTSTIGQGEFDSPTYSTVFIAPMLVLYEFAADTVMKTRARMMLDLLLADFAAEHLLGNYCGGHSRDYPEDIINPLSAPATRVAWLYFGEPKEDRWNDTRFHPRHRGSWETVFGALGSYRLPEVIYRIATDRSEPYVHTETKRVRNIIRFGQERNPPVYKYTYMTEDFALGSLQGGILQPIQQHTWDVTFVSRKPNNTVFTLHPYFSGRELAMFFPEEIQFLSGEVDRYHLVYTDPDKWNSSSPYEQTFQHENAIIVLYMIEAGARHQHIDGFFPKSLDERTVDSTGWIFSRAGSTYIALFPLKPYEWIEEEEAWRWRSHDRNNGVIVEVGSGARYGSYANFQQKIRATQIGIDSVDSGLKVRYRSTSGHLMQFAVGGPRLLDGNAIDFRDYKLFNGPFIQAEVGSGVITLKYRDRVRILDFPAARITEGE